MQAFSTNLSPCADVVQFSTTRITDGGLVLRVALKRRILDDVGLSVIFKDATRANNSAPLVPKNPVTYFNASVISQVVSQDELPSFKRFSLQVALMRGNTPGPFFNSSEVICKFVCSISSLITGRGR